MLAIGLLLFFPFMMALAASQDFLSMTISNWISLALIAGFMIFAMAIGMDWQTIAWHWAGFAITLTVTFSLFAFNIIGGGDAKLAPCTVLWLNAMQSVEYLLVASVLGGALTLFILFLRVKPLPAVVHSLPGIAKIYSPDSGIPYGIALGASALMVYPETIWMDTALKLLV